MAIGSLARRSHFSKELFENCRCFGKEMSVLSLRQLRIARALTATLFDDGTGVPPERLDYAMAELVGYAARVGRMTRLALRFALWVMQLAPFLLFGVFRTFTRASVELRERCLRRLEGSRLGLVVVLLKTVLSMIYFEHPDALASTGYDAQGLLGPAWAQGSPPPVVKLQVVHEPAGEGLPVPTALSGNALGGA